MDIVSVIVGLGTKLIDSLFPDPKIAAEAKLKLFEMQQNGVLAQITAQTDINKVEAANPSIFVSGWRPFIGWICGVGLGTQFLIAPLATWIAALMGHPLAFPQLDLSTLMTLLGGMLGLGAMRTSEKLKGVARLK